MYKDSVIEKYICTYRELKAMKNRLKSLLTAGDRLELCMDGENRASMTMETSFETLIDDHTLVIQATAYAAPNGLQSNSPIKLTASKNSAGILKMRGTIIRSSQTGNVTTLVVELAPDIQQTQRRQDYRLPILRDVRLGNGGEGYYDGLIQNISAGGIRCILPTRMRAGTKINLKLELNQECFDLGGEVLESIEINEEAQRFILRIRFIDISEKIRSRLTSHIFIEQSRQNK